MITRIRIDRIGPLSNVDIILGNVNLVLGRNESGKTSLVDFLASKIAESLPGKNPLNRFQKITGLSPMRFGGGWKGSIEGTVNIETTDEAGRETLADMLSLLVVRANRNELTNANDAGLSSLDFWKSTVRSMLAGTNVIAKKLGTIRTYTNPGVRIWKLIDTIGSYRDLLVRKKDEYDAFRKSVELVSGSADELDAVEARLDALRKMRDARAYGDRLTLYTRYMKTGSSIQEIEERLTRYDESDLGKKAGLWEKAERALHEKESERSRCTLGREKDEATARSLDASITERTKRIADLDRSIGERRHRTSTSPVDESERARLNAIIIAAEKRKKRIPLLPLIVLIAGAMSFASVLLLEYLWIVSTAISALGIILFVIIKIVDIRKAERDLREINERIISFESRAQAFLLAGEAGRGECERLDAEKTAAVARLREEHESLAALRATISRLEEDSARLVSEIASLKRERDAYIAEFGDMTRLGSIIEEVRSKKKQLASLVESRASLGNELRKAFKVDALIPSDLLARLEREKEGIDETSMGVSFDPVAYDALAAQRDAIIKRTHSYDREFAEMKSAVTRECSIELGKTGDLASKEMKGFYELFFKDIVEPLALTSVYDLESAIARCDAAVARCSAYKKYAGFLHAAVAGLESRQESILGNVIDDPVFRDMASRLMGYDAVEAKIEDREIRFLFGPERFSFEDLSTGAMHQFNLILRLTLLSKVLARPATIVLDDAFLHFDHARRIRAAEIIRDEYVSKGWQVIYTAIDDDAIERVFRAVFPGQSLNVKRLG